MPSQHLITEDKLREFIQSSYIFFDDKDKYVFLGGLIKALGSDGVHIIQECLDLSLGQIYEAESKLNEIQKKAEI